MPAKAAEVRRYAPKLTFHLSPLDWEHINLSGDYVWRNNLKLEFGKYRPLRTVDTVL